MTGVSTFDASFRDVMVNVLHTAIIISVFLNWYWVLLQHYILKKLEILVGEIIFTYFTTSGPQMPAESSLILG